MEAVKREQTLTELLAPFSPPETTFLERMRYWAAAQPDETAFRFLDGSAEPVQALTYGELDQRARAIGAFLVAEGMRGQRALLMFASGLEFVEALFGCYYAGIVPIPAYPPRRNRNMGRINAISEDANAAVALTTTDVIQRSEGMLDDAPSLKSIRWIAVEQIPTELWRDWVNPKSSPHDVALIQYTSGSTGSPKGVVLTHANLLANCNMITTAFQLDRDSVGVSWLPLYHDMGLVGGVLNPLYAGVPSVLMSPVSFLTKPVNWLRAISHFHGTCAGGPNFAYSLCAEKISDSQCADLDLSRWDLAFNGAEPVRASVLQQFTDKFAPYGFRHEAHYPCYGMAEATLIVTGGKKSQPPVLRTFDRHELTQYKVVPCAANDDNAQTLVGCGSSIGGEEVVIVHPETFLPLPADQIGEIWVRSPSVGQGYWNKTEDSERTFGARLKNRPDDRFLRTGDLGFIADGELFITGRLKDMIIIRGVNRYPQDIEATVEEADKCLKAGGGAAFAVEHWDREHLVVVCEVERGPNQVFDGVIERIRARVIEEHDIPPDAVVLVRAGSVPKTSSGKVQRRACRQNYIDNKLLVVKRWSVLDGQLPTGEASEDVLVDETAWVEEGDIHQEVIDVVMHFVRQVAKERARRLTPDSNIVVDLGLDSLERLEIARELESAFGGRIPDEVLQEVETVREVAAAVQNHIGARLIDRNGQMREAPLKPTGLARGDAIPESSYVLEKTPEFIRLQRTKEAVAKTGLRNPYFSVHEGVIADTTRIDGRELISFSSYNYLGLSGHPIVSESAKRAIDLFGTSVSASRLVSGEKTIHKQLEQELAEFLGVDDVITFPGGHATNESVIGHLVDAGDLILHDALAHNSIIQGAELSGARRRPFDHNDWRHLDRILSEIRHEYRRVLVAIEGLYSMDGDFPDLPQFVEIKKKHRCWMFVDEAHSIGTMGATGRGIGEMFNVPRTDVECWMGTLSKSFASCGGFIGGTANLIDYLRYTTPGFVFAAGIPPASVGAALGSLSIMRREPERVRQLASNAALFLDLAKVAGLDTGPSDQSPIIPVITGSSTKALQLSEGLFRAGINAQPILYPAVAEQQARIRFFITAAHQREQIEYTVSTLAQLWSEISTAAEAVVSG